MATSAEKIVLGSGYLYCLEFDSETGIPEDSVIETDSNILGYIKGGATVEYTPTKYTAIDDMGRKSKTITTDEEAHLKSGVMTWNGNTLKKLCATARVTEENGKRTVKIGGGVDDGKNYLIRFKHEDKENGNIRVTVVGKNEAGFAIQFAKDTETVINADFRAMPHDDEGTLILYEEEIAAA